MAKSILNVVMQGASGKIGKTLVFRQLQNGETVIANRPKPRVKPLSSAEEAHRERFLDASFAAKRLSQHPTWGPQYLAKTEPGKSAYTVAITDCLTSPTIKEIILDDYSGTIGDVISVRAIDDFNVQTVRVRIMKADNTLLEEGFAVLSDEDLNWNYVATLANASIAGTTIEVIASDIPGNKTVKAVIIN